MIDNEICRSIFPGPTHESAADDKKLVALCASWGKFCALGDLMEYNLSEVAEWLPR